MTDYLHALPPGYRIEEYELVRVLGSGGFGITYLGYDHHLDKAVAIKEYLPNDLAVRTDNNSVLPKSTQDQADYEWGLERFLSEAQTLARFDHRHIIKVYRFFRAHGTGYIVMEYAEGETLSAVLQRKGTLKEAELKQLLFPILDGLEAVHEADFLHRDIKPGNIVIRDDGSPVLIDFGSARQAVAGKSRSVTAIVTPGYAPIEQYSAKGHQGPWTDIYGLSAVCYRCLAGEPPDDATERLREDPFIPATQRCKGKASASLLGAIDRALRVNEGERPQTIAAWREVLADGSKSGKHTTKSVHKPVTRSAKEPAEARTGRSWSSLALVLVIVVLLGASAWQGWNLYRGMPGNGAGERITGSTPAERLRHLARMPGNSAGERITGAELKARVEEIMAEQARALVGEMVSIPGGTFLMGDPIGAGGLFKRRTHKVTIRPFKLGKYEVTVGQFRLFVEATGYRTDTDENPGCVIYTESERWHWAHGTSWRNPGFSAGDNHPVVCVNWNDAQAFVEWLNGSAGGNFRLPTDAEWEYAVRAGSTTKYHFGDDESQLCQYENHVDKGTDIQFWSSDFVLKNESCYDGVGERTAEVGRYQSNSFGLYDMHGNVMEWVQDCWSWSYDDEFYYRSAPRDGSAWTSGDCETRIFRGGSWAASPNDLRSAKFSIKVNSYRDSSLGFRLAQDR